MGTNRNRQDAEAARRAARIETNHVVMLEQDWLALRPEEAAKYPVGVSFHGTGVDLRIIAKHLSGAAIPVSVALPMPPRQYIIDKATELLDQRMAERAERIELGERLKAEAVEREAIEAIEQRLADGEDVSHAELRRMAVYRRGLAWVEQIEARTNERLAAENPKPAEESGEQETHA